MAGQIILTLFAGWLVYSPTVSLPIGIPVFALAVVLHIASLFDARRCARDANTGDFETRRKQNKDPWLAVFLSRLVPGLGHIYIGRQLWGICFLLFYLGILMAISNKIDSLFLVCAAILPAFVSYHVYVSSPVRCEGSRKQILLIVFMVVVIKLAQGHSLLFVNTKFVQTFRVPADNMYPTIMRGDGILVRLFTQYVPKRGEIVVFRGSARHQRFFLARVMAFGNESVQIMDGTIYIDGEKPRGSPFQDIQYLSMGKFATEREPFRVPRGCLFVLGDNSRNSRDSRYFGPIPEADVVGKAYKIYWPLGRTSLIN